MQNPSVLPKDDFHQVPRGLVDQPLTGRVYTLSKTQLKAIIAVKGVDTNTVLIRSHRC